MLQLSSACLRSLQRKAQNKVVVSCHPVKLLPGYYYLHNNTTTLTCQIGSSVCCACLLATLFSLMRMVAPCDFMQSHHRVNISSMMKMVVVIPLHSHHFYVTLCSWEYGKYFCFAYYLISSFIYIGFHKILYDI